jgi:hypothetical protein
MTWEIPVRVVNHFPEGACPCGRGVADAADLGIVRSFQQQEVPAALCSRSARGCVSWRSTVVFQHVPVERCRLLIADVTGALVSDGFVHSCLAKAAPLAKDVAALIRALIAASAVAGFDETTLRPQARPRRLATSPLLRRWQGRRAARGKCCQLVAAPPLSQLPSI